MAEQGTVCDLKELQQQLQALCSHYTCNELKADSKPFCSSFCKLVEHYASRWKVPLPQLRILEKSLSCFTQASAFFTVGCEHVFRTLSSLALSTFELLLFFDQKDFTQDPLRKITDTFQECCSSLARFQNVHLLQVERLLQTGGPWVCQTLHAILSETTLPQTEVEECISSEPSVFFELRVRYLLSCRRLPEAQALAKCCAQHPTVGQHLFFFQVYLTGLYKMAQHERLLEEVADFSGKDAVKFICSLESEENDDLLLGFSRLFLSQQLRRGDMHFLCDLVCLWGRLHRRLKTSKEALLKECEELILFATNVNGIFPFIRAIIQELSEDGVQFCMELCAHALRSCPPCDVITKSLIYKTMANLVPNDLEICRACALLVFFVERSVEAYKMVYILYMYPDQEYHVDCCPIGNRVRFETLQTLKKDLHFDPEFWNLIALRTSCLKLMNEKVLSAALEEIMEEKWVPNYCLKEINSSSRRSKVTRKNGLNQEKTRKGDRQNHKGATDKAPVRKVGRPRLNKNLAQKKGNQSSRRSTSWQTDRKHCNRALDSRENRRTTRLSEKVPAKRMIRTPRWLLEDSGSLDKNAPAKTKYPSFPYLPLRRRRRVVKNATNDEVKFDQQMKENQINDVKQEKEGQLDTQTASTAPQVVLELSLPDNELGTFTDEPCNRHRGLPQRLFYKPTLKVPSKMEPEKVTLGNEVILKAQDTTSLILMLHCYSKRPTRKKSGTNSQGLSSTVTCSSDQVDSSNKEQLNDKPAVEMKVIISSQTHQVTDKIIRSSRERIHKKEAVRRDPEVIDSKVTRAAALATAIAKSTVQMEVQVSSQKNRHSPRLEKSQNSEHVSNAVTKETSETGSDHFDGKLPTISAIEESKPQETVMNVEVLVNGTSSQADELSSTKNGQASFNKPTVDELIAEEENIDAETPIDNVINMPSVKVKKKNKTKMSHRQKYIARVKSDPVVSTSANDDSKSLPTSTSLSNAALEDDGFDPMEPQPECEESKLEFCCFFCHKVLKGRHLVAHAMFHYRKDECMFCGVEFKNNLKAMMHLSNHLEKLKKLQNPMANNSPKQSRAKTKQRTTVDAKTVSSEQKRKGREKKPLLTVRKLRSGYKFRDRTKQEEVQSSSAKDLSKYDVHKVNGHIEKRNKRKDMNRIENNLIVKSRLRHRSNDSIRNNEFKPVKIEKEKPLVASSEQKHEENITSKTSKETNNKNPGPREKLCCPVDGCSWFTVNKHAAFLYHILENHSLDTEPLELAFRVANNSCSICKRVLYSFEHFQHHVGRHKSEPRHPCPHKGCTARFKTTIEMRRHARKHNPLQAVCCLPGCPKLFICQWALILHEKDHFSKRSKATQSNDKSKNTQAVVKQEKQDNVIKKCVKSKEKVAPTSTGQSTKDTNSAIPKKDLSAQSAASRLLQRLRKRQIASNSQSQQVTHKRVSTVTKPNYKLKHSLQKRENGEKQSRGRKVLPPREAKSSQSSSCVKNITSGREQAKTSEVATNTDTRKTGRNSLSSCKDISNINNSKSSKYAQRKLKRTAPVDDSPVIGENINMDTTDTTDSFTIIKDKNYTLEEMEQVQTHSNAEEIDCQNTICKISIPTTVDSRIVVENGLYVTVQNEQKAEDDAIVGPVGNANSFGEANMADALTEADLALVMEYLAEENPEIGKDNMAPKAEECQLEPISGFQSYAQDNSKMEATKSSEEAPANLPTFEKDTEENSNMIFSSNASSNGPIITAEEQNVALSQNIESTDHICESNDRNVVQIPEDKLDIVLEHSVEMADGPISQGNINTCAFENTLKVTKEHLAAEDISILEKLKSTDFTANSSLMEQVEAKESENITTEGTIFILNPVNTSNSETSEPGGAQQRFRPKCCNKNEMLSALKTFVKSKNDKVKTVSEVESSAVKRKIEQIKTSTSKKFHSEIQVQDSVVASASTSSASEQQKTMETTDSSTIYTFSNVKSSKEGKVKKHRNKSQSTKTKDVRKKLQTVQSKIQKKSRTSSKCVVDKGTKKTKREKSEAKSARPKSKICKMKASIKLDTAPPEMSSYEVTRQSIPTEDCNQASTEQNHNREYDGMEAETKPEMLRVENMKDPEDETTLRPRDVNDLVPEQEENPLTTFEKALSEYKKRPYMRLPATAYLEEKFTVMPKRRKDMSVFFGSSRSPKVQSTPQQRHRCANCFSSFSSDGELQWHLQQKCSNLFGFDSDEEGTS